MTHSSLQPANHSTPAASSQPADQCLSKNVPDRDLLRRFLQDADEQAFAQRVHRHQGLVLGVCRRILGDAPEVDDAFQAVFIALARRPKSIRQEASVSTWLYSVAWRTSWRLVRTRRKHAVEPLSTHPAAPQIDPLEQIGTAQDCVVLDEELNQLPTRYRRVLVMSYFAEQTSQQIADELNVSKGTIDGRLRQARNLLRVRLARRGVAIGVLAVAAGMSTGPAAAASPALLNTTLQLGAQTLSGSAPGTTDLSQLEPLIRPETTMFTSKLFASGMLCMTAIAGTAGFGIAQDGGGAAGPGAGAGGVIQNAGGDAGGTGAPIGIDGVTIQQSGPNGAPAGTAGGGAGAAPVVYNLYPDSAGPRERWMYDVLSKTAADVEFPGETPIGDILQLILEHASSEHGEVDGQKFAFALTVDRAALTDVGVLDLSEVNVRDINFSGVSLRSALNHIFEQTGDIDVSPAELTWVIRNEMLLITTVERSQEADLMTTRVYPVGNLLAVELDRMRNLNRFQPMFGGMMGGGQGFFSVAAGQFGSGAMGQAAGDMSGGIDGEMEDIPMTPLTPGERLTCLIVEMTSNSYGDNWSSTVGGKGTIGDIRQFGNNLLVRQTPKLHEKIVLLLNQLSKAATN